ncbi:MAG: hypothetical protein ABW039_10560 [Sphingobium sp.]
MPESLHSLAALRRQIASLDRAPARESGARIATGHAPLDAELDGGLARGQIHELFGAATDEGTATGVALALAQRTGIGAPLLSLRSQAACRAGGLPYGPGLAALGIDPARLLIGILPDDAMLLRAAVDALRCPALGALLLDLRGPAPLLDLTASRRLALAAEASGVTAFLLRIGGDPAPSAAATRWRVEPAASDPLPGDAPGLAACRLTLLRRRGGADGGSWRLVWDGERGIFGDGRHERHDDAATGHGTPLSGDLATLPADRPASDRAA